MDRSQNPNPQYAEEIFREVSRGSEDDSHKGEIGLFRTFRRRGFRVEESERPKRYAGRALKDRERTSRGCQSVVFEGQQKHSLSVGVDCDAKLPFIDRIVGNDEIEVYG